MKICSSMLTVVEGRSYLAQKEHLNGLRNMVTNCHDFLSTLGTTDRSLTFSIDDEEGEDTLGDTPLLCQKTGNTETKEELDKMLDTVSLGGLSLDSGQGTEDSSPASSSALLVSSMDLRDHDRTTSITSFRRLSLPSIDLHDQKGTKSAYGGAKKCLRKVRKLFSGKPKEDLRIIAEEGRNYSPTLEPLLPVDATPEGPFYVLIGKEKKNPLKLLCVQHELNRERVNTDHCQVTQDDRLVNRPPCHGLQRSQRFRNYWGTCSTSPVHPPPSPSSLISVSNLPQYWETEAAVTIKERRVWWRVLEIGLVEEDKLDSAMWIYCTPRSWCVRVGLCGIHGVICTQVWNQREHVKCLRDPVPEAPGTYTLRYGVVVDIVRGRVGFVDVERGEVLQKMDVKFNQTIYPVFGLDPYPDFVTLDMRSMCGRKIIMTENKQNLIYSCLT